MKQLIHNAIIINRDRRFHGHIILDGTRIEALREGDPDAASLSAFGSHAIDLRGHWLLPGAIDSHVHFRDPGLTHKADMASESRAAIAGGITSFIDMPNTRPATLSMALIREKQASAARSSLANYSFYIGASADNLDELRNADYSIVPGIKLFLGSSTGNMCVASSEALDAIFSLPRLIAVHCEDEGIINSNTAEVKELYGTSPIPISLHSEVRSALACYKSTLSAVRRARRLGTRLHICHISTAEELSLCTRADNITAEVCIPHLWFDDTDYATLSARIKCNPAVKSARHRTALRKALLTGEIDVVSTDHAPHTLAEKEGDLLAAPSGMPMVQFSLRAMLQLAREGVLTPERVVRLMCHNQAELFGIEGRGYLDEGCYADMVEIEPAGTTVPVSQSEIASKCGWSPMEGTLLPDVVRRVWVNGRLAYADGEFATETTAMPLHFCR